jgi:hypothetical protein
MVRHRLDALTAAALRWWLRNELFFDLALDTRHDEVLPVRYETLVQDPVAGMNEIFAFLGLAPTTRAVRRIGPGRIGRGRDLVIDATVSERCRALEARLDAVIAAWGVR